MVIVIFPIAFIILLSFYLFVGWSLFFVFVFMSLDSSLINQELILSVLLSFWLVIKFCHYYYYGSIRLCYIIILNCITLDYFILLYHYYLFSTVFIFLFLFSFFIISLILCCICCFISYLLFCVFYRFYH